MLNRFGNICTTLAYVMQSLWSCIYCSLSNVCMQYMTNTWPMITIFTRPTNNLHQYQYRDPQVDHYSLCQCLQWQVYERMLRISHCQQCQCSSVSNLVMNLALESYDYLCGHPIWIEHELIWLSVSIVVGPGMELWIQQQTICTIVTSFSWCNNEDSNTYLLHDIILNSQNRVETNLARNDTRCRNSRYYTGY